MSYLDWKVGDKVVCIDADGSGNLEKNCVYTIKKLDGMHLRRWRGNIRMTVDVHLVEVNCRADVFGFAIERFRKVQHRKTDISIFTSMLNTTKKVVDA